MDVASDLPWLKSSHQTSLRCVQSDKSVPYDGFETDRARVWPTLRSVKYWARFNQCAQNPEEERSPGLLKQTWTGGRNNTEVCLYTLEEAGHALPMRPTDAGPIKGSATLWKFLVRDRVLKLQPGVRVFTGDRIYITTHCGPLPVGAEFRYTVDGSAPTPTSPLFAGPPTLTTTATFRAQCFVQSKPVGSELSARYHHLALRPAQPVAHPVPGLRYAYYPGGWDSLPDLASLKPAASGTCAAPDLTLVAHRPEDYVFAFTGYIHAPTDGVYVFSITSDDGSAVYVGDTRIIDNDGLHEPLERSRALALAAGYHPISIRYLQRAKDAVLSLTLQLPGQPARPLVPADVVYEK